MAAQSGGSVCMQIQCLLRKVVACRFAIALAIAVAPLALLSTRPALGACAPLSGVVGPGDTVVCTTTTTDQDASNGYGTGAENGLTINVLSGAAVTGTNNGLWVGNNNVINNTGTITGLTAAFPDGNGILAGGPAAGPITLTVNNAAGATISGDLNGILATNAANDAVLNVVNSGTIAGTGAGGSAGVAASIVNLINNGTITATDEAVSAFGAGTSSVVNSGTITGDNRGVNIGTGTVVNSAGGAIRGTGALSVGVSMADGAVVNSGAISGAIRGISATTATITNLGTVTSTGGGAQDFAINLGNGTLNNFGTVQSLAASGIAVASNTNLTVNNAGTIAANGGSGIAIDVGALASINNSGTISATGLSGIGVQVQTGAVASIVNRGTIVGGTGVFLQSGAGTPGSGSTLINSGTIIGTEGIAIDSSVFGGNTLIFHPGSRVIGQVLLGIGDTVNVQTGRDISSLLTFCVCGGVSLSVTGGAPFAINGIQIAVLDPTAFSLADRSLTDFTGMLSSLITGRFNEAGAPRPPTGSASAFAPSLGGLADIVSPAFAGIAGLAYARDNGTSSVPTAAFEDRVSGISVWSKGFVGGRRQQADGPMLPATTLAYGGALGIDKNIGPDIRVGAFVGAGQGRLSVDLDSQKIETDYVFAGLYSRIYRNAQFIDVMVTGGSTSNDSTRLIVHNLAPGGYETATASYQGWFISPEIAYGVRIPIDPNVTATPGARLRYSVGHSSGYSEAGSAQNLTVDDRTFHNLEGRLEMALSRFDEITAKGWLKTTVTLGGLAMQRLGGQTISTVLIGQSLIFSAPGDETVGGFYTGWGFDYLTGNGLGVFVAAEGSVMSDKSMFGTARGGVRVYF
jgi:hypothetical protein